MLLDDASRLIACRVKLFELHVPIPCFAAVVGEHDAAFGILAEVLDVVELADRDATLPFGITDGRFDDFHPIEPMLDAIVFHHDLCRIPFARRMGLGPLDRFVEIIDRTCLCILRCGSAGIVIDLVLTTQRPIAVGSDAVLEAAVAPRSYLPIEAEFKVAELSACNDVSRSEQGFAKPDDACLRFPTRGGGVAIDGHPTG